MFLWTQLVINELKYCYSDAAMEETIQNLPRGLKAAYGRILDRIMDPTNPPNARNMAIRILGWMACSYRALKSYELLDGIAFDATNTILNSKTRIRRDILDLCRPLIEDSPTGTIDFVHFSAKEYILEEAYQASRPFIWRENAHLDISFSCISVLASSLALLPTNCTDSERAGIIVHGFHGLHIYADHFWYKHLLEYCDFLHRNNRQISLELLVQLNRLLNYKKAHPGCLTSIAESGEMKLFTKPPCLDVLNHAPEVKDLVLEVLEFRSRPDLAANSSDKSLDAISLAMCDTDPTHFSAARQSYQRTTESLLRDDALVLFPTIEFKHLEAFRDTYGSTAFVCRYPGCNSNTDGFETSGQRAQHESKHQRRLRCGFRTCFSFTTGFATRGLLKGHNDKWHSAVVDGLSLAQSLKAASPVSVHSNTVSHILQDSNLDLFDGFFFGNADNLVAPQPRPNGQLSLPLANTNVAASQQLDKPAYENVLQGFDFDAFLREGDDVENFNFDTDPLIKDVPADHESPPPDYQEQPLQLERQNKRWLMMAREEQDKICPCSSFNRKQLHPNPLPITKIS
ncbi:hypothetical protein HYALB_00009402 [Hymenoscyphus albidus]|uniref:GPI inositol-deacylase winged helix domain-containing protein n=1 Tax=Hymenoscyphus albidus TaxID=595503 RepID=A0A9N9LMK6_9HELO|nr:hypothetical protein HYALB_00009402 [Hymenoscyphus albidus]